MKKKWHNKFDKDWAENFTADLVYTDIMDLLDGWEEFRQSLMTSHKRSDETDGDCLSRLRKRWKNNLKFFWMDYTDWKLMSSK